MGAVTLSAVKPYPSGRNKHVDATATFSASYATGGDTIKPNALGLQRITDVLLYGTKGTAALGLQVVLGGTDTAPTLKVSQWAAGTPAEIASTTNLSTRSVKLRFIGY